MPCECEVSAFLSGLCHWSLSLSIAFRATKWVPSQPWHWRAGVERASPLKVLLIRMIEKKMVPQIHKFPTPGTRPLLS
jgi:hypothetical protein